MNKPDIDTSAEAIDRFFDRKIDTILPSNEAFRQLLMSGKQLKFYMGADVTAPRLHIGHIIPYLKMAQLQKMGHQIIFLIGDFTGKIGDPTDKSAARRKLTDEEVKTNSQAFIDQIKALFDFDDPVNPPLIKFNSEWNNKLSFADVIELASNFTVQQMLERDMFEKRINENKPVYLHEFLYPLIQGYDSVAMEVDGEFGGSDQTFNMLAGRTLSKALLNKEKFVLTMKLLLSADGINKMSKSIGNCIFINDPAEEKYAKIMAIPDDLIMHYFELLSDLSDTELEATKIRAQNEPMTVKKELAYLVVEMFNGAEEAKNAQETFKKVVQDKEVPDDIQEVKKQDLEKTLQLKELLVKTGLVNSNSEAKRLIMEGAVEIDGIKETDPNKTISLEKASLIKAGKRKWIKLI
ncbi:MAG TPA: tyrosine--tRNA ligase [Candidatus Dojkabacteria bacterium]|nr:tyrosine--tRNA ligase [Candidatus Dojkabacteria bacterium]